MLNLELERGGQIPSQVENNPVLRVSIVCYDSNQILLKETLISLLNACAHSLREQLLKSIEIVLVDNGPTHSDRKKIESILQWAKEITVDGVALLMCGSGHNLGFAAGHNLTFSPKACDFHLVLNPDVELAPDALAAAIEFMIVNDDCGILAPMIFDSEGVRQYLCKRYPTVFDLLVRGFAPQFLRALFQKRLANYEMRDLIGDAVVWNPPIVSGCFMMLRSSLLEKLQGFDSRYFLYFEDFDLSLRAREMTQIAYVPSVRIIHHGGYAAHKGWRHIFMFIHSAIKFFSRFGWRWY